MMYNIYYVLVNGKYGVVENPMGEKRERMYIGYGVTDVYIRAQSKDEAMMTGISLIRAAKGIKRGTHIYLNPFEQ